MAEPDPRRRTFGPVVLLGLVAGGLTAIAGDNPVAEADGRATFAITYDAHLPLATALGLVVLACWGVVLVTRGRVRRAVAALGTLASAGAVAAVVVGWWQVPDQLREELAAIGSDPAASHTVWWWLALVGAAASVAATAVAVLLAPAWPEMGTRYDAPTGAGPAPTTPPEEQTSLDLWKAIDEGRDPTAAEPE
ncbi:Trp biosynthesis-associated membrane protein [Nocardioides sp.]|uniref:Trp biosynthesis-associated membrane protein n=1 Tax=Nocardioides sp. TaxID=35761 RepID=UPI0025F80B42|nr:Trp biosynthesis-associated membrane protein [Nocardioides sp.]